MVGGIKRVSVRFKKRRFVLGGDMPKVTEAHLEARRMQILDAAAQCFVQKGFHHSTMQDICRHAELSPGAVYRYFRSKEEIIEAMTRERKRMVTAMIEAAKARGGFQRVFTELADVHFSELEDPQACALAIELWAEALRSPSIMHMVRGQMSSIREALIGIIRIAQNRGEINPALDPRAVAEIMISLFDGLLLQKVIEDDTDVWKYVGAMKAMINGTFWQRRKLEGVD